MKKEEWKSIPNFEGVYEVSSYGRVKSLKFNREKILKLGTAGSEKRKYYTVCLMRKNVLTKIKYVHILVAEAFLNHVPNGYQSVVDHLNNDSFDNRIENLRIVTQRENSSKSHIKSTSKYTGVSWDTYHKKWHARIYFNGKQYNLGLFTDEYDAHLAYQNKLNSL